jgi:NADH-quinone oxidoreductase subunit I
MGYLTDTVRTMGETLRNIFRKPTTVHYPDEKRVRAERYRSSFALVHDENDEEACIGCFMCERICPSQVITVVADKKRESPATGKKRGYCKDFTLDLNACIFCELCVQVCPTDAIVMLKVTQEPGFTREALCLTMDKLYENEKLDQNAWGTGTKLMEMQDPKRGQPKPVKKKVAKKVVKKVAEPAPSANATASADSAPEPPAATQEVSPTEQAKPASAGTPSETTKKEGTD